MTEAKKQSTKILGIWWYEWVYVAISIATFIHSSWAYAITMQGPEPLMDWANFNLTPQQGWAALTFLMWHFWGGLMAIAIDVSMFFSSREIRRGNGVYLLAFISAATFSAATQLMYAATHAAPLTYVESTLPAMQEGVGWMWFASESRLIYLPLSLPFTATIYTIAILFEQRRSKVDAVMHEAQTLVQEAVSKIMPASPEQKVVYNTTVVEEVAKKAPERDIPLSSETFSAREAAAMTGRNYQYVLTLCKRGKIGRKDPNNGEWILTEHDIARLERRGIHQEAPEEAQVIVVEPLPELPASTEPPISHHGS